jgi:hypothetical protein
MNKVHEKIIFTKNGLSIQKLWQEAYFFVKNGQLLFLPSTREKNLFFPIHAVNFCKTFCTCSPNSLGKDPTIINAKKIKNSFGLLELEIALWGVF